MSGAALLEKLYLQKWGNHQDLHHHQNAGRVSLSLGTTSLHYYRG